MFCQRPSAKSYTENEGRGGEISVSDDLKSKPTLSFIFMHLAGQNVEKLDPGVNSGNGHFTSAVIDF